MTFNVQNNTAIFDPKIKNVEISCMKHGKQMTKSFNLTGDWTPGRCQKCLRDNDDYFLKKHSTMSAADQIANLLFKSNVPRRYEKAAFSDFIPKNQSQKDVLNQCIEYANSYDERAVFGRSLILSGTTGTGKTMLACAVANYVIKQHRKTAFFSSAIDLITSVKGSYQKNEGTKLEEFSKYNLLVLDDVGVGYDSTFERVIFSQILDKRYQNMYPTIVTSNLTPKELKEYLTERNASRLRENGGLVLALDWEDERR